MIQIGSTVILQTEEAIFCTCKIVGMSAGNISISYCAGTKRDKRTGEYRDNHPVETISRKKILQILERT